MKHHHHHHTGGHPLPSLNTLAAMATLHCLSGCAIGEALGMFIGAALGWGNAATLALAMTLAFLSGYGLSLHPLLRSGMGWSRATHIALAADTASIATMEAVDNLSMLLIPGAMDATPASLLFWVSLALSLALAGMAAYPVNRWLIARGRGHALTHGHH